jgi:hypothetical protein
MFALGYQCYITGDIETGRAGYLAWGLCLPIKIIRTIGLFINNAARFLIAALISVDDDDAILFPLGYGFVGTHKCTYRLSTVVAWRSHVADKDFWEFPFLLVEYPHPACRSCGCIMPILAGY